MLLLASKLWQVFLLLLTFFSSLSVTVAALPVIAGVPGVASISEVPHELAIAGSPTVIAFLLLMAFLLLLHT